MLDSKKIISKVKIKLAEDDPDKEYATLENDTIKTPYGKEEPLKKWVDSNIEDFCDELVYIPLIESEKETLMKRVKETVKELLPEHIKSFFKKNKNKVDEDEWENELKDIKKQIKKHYIRVSRYIESTASEYIDELNSSLKLY